MYDFRLDLISVCYLVIPAMTRSDPGTENGLLATCQTYLRQYCGDSLAGEKSHVYGSSLQNQVIYLHHDIADGHVSNFFVSTMD